MSVLTIVVTTYNRPEWLAACLKSIRATTDSRILVVDDASASLEARSIAKRAGADYLRLNENHGYARARVRALEDVHSTFLSFVDDDDLLWPNWFDLHLDKAEHDVIAASFWETDETGRRRPPTILEPVTLDGLLSGFVPVNDGAWIRTEAIQGIPWRPERDRVMMMSMWLALAAQGRSFATIREPCWVHRIHDSNMSSSLDEQDAAYRREAIAEWSMSPSS